MLPLILLILAVIYSICHLSITRHQNDIVEIFLSYTIFFNIGVMGLLGFYAHTFMPSETAKEIRWATGSPFQFEVTVAHLAFGVLGILAIWLRGLFWVATILGNAIFLLGAFGGHIIQYSHGDTARL